MDGRKGFSQGSQGETEAEARKSEPFYLKSFGDQKLFNFDPRVALNLNNTVFEGSTGTTFHFDFSGQVF